MPESQKDEKIEWLRDREYRKISSNVCILEIQEEKRMKKGENEWGRSNIWGNNGWQFSETFQNVKLHIQEAIQISSRIKFRIRRCGIYHDFIYTYFVYYHWTLL